MASLSPYAITLGSTDYPVKYAGLLSYVEPYLTNLESFTFSAGNVSLAGNFTLGAASDLTLNKGTANGVLYLNGSKVATSGSALTFDGTNAATTGTSSATKFIPTGGTATGNGMYLSAANTLGWSTNGVKQLELDASGNLGLGVTPSAWLTYTALQIKNSALSAIDNNQIVLSQNGLYTTGSAWKYINTNYATLYQQTSGQHLWFTAPSGTAGNAISFTQAMTLDASGRLGIGLTNPAYRLDVEISGGPYNARFANSSTSTSEYNVTLWGQGASGSAIGYVGTGGSAVGNAAFQNTFVVGTQTSSALVFNTADTERARITSGGQLLIATTNASVTAGSGFKFLPADGGTDIPRLAIVTAGSNGSNVPISIYSTGAAANRFYVNDAGTIFATSTTITAISDQRLKENIRDLDAGLSEVMALKPRKFDWKAGRGKDKKDDRGWIAQEFEQVFPDMVDTWLDPAPEGEAPYKAVNADLIPVLVKAIQEQQALITDLRARVAALEAQP